MGRGTLISGLQLAGLRDAKDKADTILPLSNYDSADPEDLWAWMATYEERTGGRVLAIAHNGNLSNGWLRSSRSECTTVSGGMVRCIS